MPYRRRYPKPPATPVPANDYVADVLAFIRTTAPASRWTLVSTDTDAGVTIARIVKG